MNPGKTGCGTGERIGSTLISIREQGTGERMKYLL